MQGPLRVKLREADFLPAAGDGSATVKPAGAGAPPFRIEHHTVLVSAPDMHWAQSRAALIPEDPPRVIMTTR